MKRPAPGVHAIVPGGRDFDKFDAFLAEEALETLLAAAVGPDRDAVETLRGDEVGLARLLDSVRTRSLFAERRAVVVRGAQLLKGDEAGWGDYLDDPTPGLSLILVVAPKPDRRRAIWKLLLGRAQTLVAEPLKDQALRRRIGEELGRRRLELEPEAVEELLDRVGQDLRRLVGEIEKLQSFAGGRGRLSLEEVSECLGRGLARPLYRLGDAIAARRAEEALRLAEELLEEGEEAPRILGTIYRSLRQMRLGALAREQRLSREQAAARLQLPERMAFKVPQILESARAWSGPDLQRGMRALGLADRRMKSGVDPSVALTPAIAEVCGAAAPFRPSPRGGR